MDLVPTREEVGHDPITSSRGMVTTSESDLPESAGAVQPPGLRFAWAQRRWVPAIVVVLAGIALFAAYLAQARTLAVHLDVASASGPQALQAWDMLHGNVLLRGWQLADVSFYTTELPEYMLVELVRGLNGDTVHVAAALTYTLAVLLAAWLAKGRATGREGLVRLLVAAGVMLAPSLGSGTSVLLSGPDHTGTQVPLLLTWLVLDRARPRWWVPALVAVMLAWAQVADALVLYEGVLPLVAVCAARMYRRRGPLTGQWYELSLAVGALASVVAARLALTMIRLAGGFAVKTPSAGFSTAATMSAEFWLKVQRVFQVFGAGFFGLPFGLAAIAALVHIVGVALVAWAVAVAARRFPGENDLIVPVLTIAFMVVLAAYVFGTKSDPNEIVGLLPIGAVLAGRLLAGRLISRGLVPALAVALACYGGILVHNTLQPPARSQSQPTASWLEAHHLTYGLAEFGEANSVTVDSGNRVQLRPARLFRHELVTTPWETDSSWYDIRRHDATFVIWRLPSTTCTNGCQPLADLLRTFGRPAATYRVGDYRVLVWRKNLLSDLPTLSWCGKVWPWNALSKPSPAPCK